MIKIGQLKVVIIILLSVVLHHSSYSQKHKYLVINGKILAESNDNDKSSLQITKNSQEAISFQLPEHDRFRIELEYNAEYKLVFNKKGNQQKTIIINTEIPENNLNSGSNFPNFLMAVKLFADDMNSQDQYSENQVQHIGYSQQRNCFERTPSVLNVEYVEKGKPFFENQPKESKAEMQKYQVF